ncbi:MAG: hypothetical protein WDO71_22715 [Bacteroidota bacterium]
MAKDKDKAPADTTKKAAAKPATASNKGGNPKHSNAVRSASCACG